MRSDISEFLRGVSAHLFGLLSGGIVAFVVALLEHWSGRSLSPSIYVSIVAIGLFVSCFVTWREQFHARGHLLNISGEFESDTLILSIRNDGPTDSFSGAITWVDAPFTTERANPYPLTFKWMDKEPGSLRLIQRNGTKRVELLRVTTWENPSTHRQECREVHLLSQSDEQVAVQPHWDDGATNTFVSLKFRSVNRDQDYQDSISVYTCPGSESVTLRLARDLRF